MFTSMSHATRGKKNSIPPLLHTQRCIQSSPPPTIWQIWPQFYSPDSCLQAKTKAGAPVTRSITKWSDDEDAMLQDCFASTDWNMFRDSSNGIEKYTTSVIGFINKCIDDVGPTVTVRTYANQKPWITGNIRIKLKASVSSLSRFQGH